MIVIQPVRKPQTKATSLDGLRGRPVFSCPRIVDGDVEPQYAERVGPLSGRSRLQTRDGSDQAQGGGQRKRGTERSKTLDSRVLF